MSDMNYYKPDLFELVNSNGEKRIFELIDCANINDEIYYVMIPAIEDDDFLNIDCEPVILKTVYEDGEELFASIDDDDEYDMVADIFMQRQGFYDDDDYDED